MSIYSIAKITAEATAAAQTTSNVNNVCRYPFQSSAGYIYQQAFKAARVAIEHPTNVEAAAGIIAALDQFEAVA